MAKLTPAQNLLVEETEPGVYVCELDGGTIRFTHRENGRYSVDVGYTIMPGYGTHFGPFDSLDDAGYRITHGVIPARLAALLLKNRILVKEA